LLFENSTSGLAALKERWMMTSRGRKTVVKSIRLSPNELAWAMEACDRLGADYGGTPTGAMKLMIYAGMNSVLGRDWTTEEPPEHQRTKATQTKQPISPAHLGSEESYAPTAGRFSGINPALPDEDYRNVWDVLKNEHLTPADQLGGSPRIAAIAADLLSRYAWDRLTTDEQALVKEVLNESD
jgi:hypothetical protein